MSATRARWSLAGARRRHPVAGLIVKDLFRDIDLWLVDEGLEISLPAGTAFATLYFAPDRFVMTSGVGVPLIVNRNSPLQPSPKPVCQ